jgi:hypothetical protein
MRRPTGPRRRWPRRWGSARLRCGGSGRGKGCSRIGCAPSRSNDPEFADKLKDVVGLYVDLPARAVVLSIDEKSQIQALDRTQPGTADEEEAVRHHDPRLQAQRHYHPVRRPRYPRRQGHRALHATTGNRFIRFLNTVEREAPAGKAIHVILDNYDLSEPPVAEVADCLAVLRREGLVV